MNQAERNPLHTRYGIMKGVENPKENQWEKKGNDEVYMEADWSEEEPQVRSLVNHAKSWKKVEKTYAAQPPPQNMETIPSAMTTQYNTQARNKNINLNNFPFETAIIAYTLTQQPKTLNKNLVRIEGDLNPLSKNLRCMLNLN